MSLPLAALRGLVLCALALAAVALTVDAGSVVWARAVVPGELREAGRVAAEAVAELPRQRRAAVLAHRAADQEGRLRGLTVARDDFALLPDGSVRLRGSRTAPTLVLDRFPRLRELTVVEASAVVAPPSY